MMNEKYQWELNLINPGSQLAHSRLASLYSHSDSDLNLKTKLIGSRLFISYLSYLIHICYTFISYLIHIICYTSTKQINEEKKVLFLCVQGIKLRTSDDEKHVQFKQGDSDTRCSNFSRGSQLRTSGRKPNGILTNRSNGNSKTETVNGCRNPENKDCNQGNQGSFCDEGLSYLEIFQLIIKLPTLCHNIITNPNRTV